MYIDEETSSRETEIEKDIVKQMIDLTLVSDLKEEYPDEESEQTTVMENKTSNPE